MNLFVRYLSWVGRAESRCSNNRANPAHWQSVRQSYHYTYAVAGTRGVTSIELVHADKINCGTAVARISAFSVAVLMTSRDEERKPKNSGKYDVRIKMCFVIAMLPPSILPKNSCRVSKVTPLPVYGSSLDGNAESSTSAQSIWAGR